MPHSDAEDWIATHEALKDSSDWDDLAFDGIQGGGGALLVEHRRCPDCGSTLSRPVDVMRASQLLTRLGELLGVSVAAVATAARALTETPPAAKCGRRGKRAAASTEPALASIERRRAA
jgi:hypothetical protein